MMKYLKHFLYLIKYKYYATIECFRNELYLQGITHGLSKFLLREFIPYAKYYYGKYPMAKNLTEEQKFSASLIVTKDMISEAFDIARLLHERRNMSCWSFWILFDERGNSKALEIPKKYALEMICGWVATAQVHKKGVQARIAYADVKIWYKTHKNRIILHRNTRAYIEEVLKITYPVAKPALKKPVETPLLSQQPSSIKMKLDIIRECCAKAGWDEIDFQPITKMISFSKDGTRINIYYTTMTVATCLSHPVKGKTQLFRKNVNFITLEKILQNPRQHTNKGYYTS